MSESEFWGTTPKFFYARWKAWESKQHIEWEQARLSGYLAAAFHFDMSKPVRPIDLYPFAWEDVAPKFEPVDIEVMKKLNEEAKAFFESQGLKIKPKDGNSTPVERKDGAPDQGVRLATPEG